jgi:RNA polymerase sigma-70 factor (ECF subfamily)
LSTLSTTAPTTTGDVASIDGAGNETFEQLIALHEPRVRRLARRLLGWNDADADDVVQDVFLVLLNKLGTFRGDASLATWLTTVTINRCRSQRRKAWVRLKWLSQRMFPPGPSEQANGADHAAERDDTNARVRAAVASLPPRDREVIALYYLEQLSSAEVASVLGIASSAVDTRLHRARSRLKESLKNLAID